MTNVTAQHFFYFFSPVLPVRRFSLLRILSPSTEIVVSPPFVYLDQVRKTVRKDVAVAGQNCYSKASGAYTGEVA